MSIKVSNYQKALKIIQYNSMQRTMKYLEMLISKFLSLGFNLMDKKSACKKKIVSIFVSDSSQRFYLIFTRLKFIVLCLA